MKILEAITMADAVRDNDILPAVKIKWLSSLDGGIWRQMQSQYDGQGDPAQTMIGDGRHDGDVDEIDPHVFWPQPRRPDPVPAEMPRYTDETDASTVELLVPEPYDDLYIDYLVAMIDYTHGDIDRYNNAASKYGMRLQEYRNDYTRTHRFVGQRGLRF